MTDELDFVQYLRQWASVNPNDQTIRDLHRAADEIERLRKERDQFRKFWSYAIHERDENETLRTIIQDIANAITDEGIKPGYHKQQVNYVRTMWNPLWQAIGKAVKEMEIGTSKS
jgi:predicted RNase H-like nuclease (RuvC/YqgF family)